MKDIGCGNDGSGGDGGGGSGNVDGGSAAEWRRQAEATGTC